MTRRRREGTEPLNARSALGLRILLSALFMPLFAAGAVGFAVVSGRPAGDRTALYAVLAGVCAVLTVVAAVDLVGLVRRRRPGGTRR